MICYAYRTKHPHHHPGFTLLEIMVSFALIALLAVGVIIQFRRLSPAQTLENAVDVTRSLLLQARTTAITGSPYGYGVFVDLDSAPQNTLILFAETEGDYVYTTEDTILSTTVLDNDVSLTACTDGSTITTTGSCTVIFRAPGFAGVHYNGTDTATTLTWTLTEPVNATSANLLIYPATYVVE